MRFQFATAVRGDRLILPLPSNEALARHLADAGGRELGTIKIRQFPDGES